MPIVKVGSERIKFPDSMSQEQIRVALSSRFPAKTVPNEPRRRQTGVQRRQAGVERNQTEQETQSLIQRFDAGEITAKDIPDDRLDDFRKAKIDALPSVVGNMKRLSENIGFGRALATMTAFDPREFGDILMAADPDIGIVETPEGELLAFNNKTGEGFSVNKLGPSITDAFQVAGSAALLAPAAAASSLVGAGVVGAGITTLLEADQSNQGGSFDVAPIVTAGVAPVAVGKVLLPAVKAAVAPLLSRGGTTGAADDIFRNLTPDKKVVKEMLEAGEPEGAVAGYIVNGAGKVKKDPIARAALNQGYDPTIVSQVAASSTDDLLAAREMLRQVAKGTTNKVFAQKNRPGEEVGKTLMKRVNAVQGVQKKASREIGVVAKGLKNEPVNYDQTIVKFLDDLEDLRVGIDPEDASLVFQGSQIEGQGANQKVLNLVYDRLKKGGDSNGFDAHDLKQFVSSQINFGKKLAEPISARVESVMKGVRAGVNESIRDVSPQYAKANDVFASAAESFDLLNKSTGRHFDPLSDSADQFLGQIARRLTGNAQSRLTLTDAIKSLERVSEQNGIKFTDDVFHQNTLVSELERMFPTAVAQTSFRGELVGAGADVARVATGQQTATGTALKVAGKAASVIKGQNQEKAIRAMDKYITELLKRSNKPN